MTRLPARRRSRRLFRLLSALLAVAAAVAGPPAVLLLLVGNPLDVPTALRHAGALQSPLGDHTLLWLLATVGWLLWLHLQGTLVVEVLRQTRGSTLHMPLPGLLFGANNLLASQLVATLLLSLHPPTAAGHLLTPAVAHAAVTATTTSSHAAAPSSAAGVVTFGGHENTSTTPPVAADRAIVQCRVLPPQHRHHDTLWDIAERHLGDGTRWRDIFALNDGRLMPDGHRLTKASLIYPGWILRLPADATVRDVDRVDPSPEPTPAVIASAPPGPELAGASGPGASAPPALDRPVPPATGQQPAPPPHAHGADAPLAPAAPSVSFTATAPPATEGPAAVPDHRTGTTSPAAEAAVVGGLALAALGLLEALTRRRKVAARRRPPGTLPATPAPELTATEAQLRRDARTAADIAATVRLALLLAARHTTRLTVNAVWHHADGSLELVLANLEPGGDTGAVAAAPFPFEATDLGWRLPPGARRYLFATSRSTPLPDRISDALQGAVDPFPLLLAVGTQDGSACYVNLETFGLVSLLPADPATGPTVAPAEVLGALVQALAGAPWSELVQLAVAAPFADLAIGMDHIDVLHPRLLAQLVEFVDAGVSENVRQAGSLDRARRTDPDGAGILGTVVLAGVTAEQLPSRLLQAATRPTEPLAILLLDPHQDAHPWQLHPDGTLTIPGIATALQPLRLLPEEHQLLLRLLEHAQDPPQAAADDPGLLARAADNPPPEAPVEPAGPTDDAVSRHADPRPDDQEPGLIDLTALDNTAPAAHPIGDQTHNGLNGVPASTDALAGAGDHPAAPGSQHGADEDVEPVQISILGPLVLSGTDGTRPRGHVRELLVYLALHRRPVTSQRLWEAVFPDRPYNAHVLRSRMSDLRRHIRRQLVTEGQAWSLAPEVTCDWQRFRALAAGTREQQFAALTLVRGLPFDGLDADWLHLEGHHAEIEAAIVDLALSRGEHALDSGDPTTAGAAATAGLRASPYDERLYQLAMRAAAERGATGQIRALRRQLERVLDEELEPDDTLQPSTERLYRDLLDAQRPRRR